MNNIRIGRTTSAPHPISVFVYHAVVNVEAFWQRLITYRRNRARPQTRDEVRAEIARTLGHAGRGNSAGLDHLIRDVIGD